MGASFQRFMLFVFGALISGANASAQCSFNYELYFDPQVFPDYSSGYDGNNYADEAAALMAAKFAYFGPTATYATQPVTQVCKGANISVELSMVQGGGPGEIHFWGSGTYPLSNFSGSSILQITAVRGFCTGGVMTGTRQEVYAPGYVLTCKHLVLPNLSLIGASEVRPTGTGGTSIITFTAKTTTPNGQPKAGVALNFSADVKAYSGGHEHHDATREKGTVTPTQGVTNAAGELVVKFAAPKAAGTHTIKATCASCSNKEVSKEFRSRCQG